ncbi:MAG: methyltransferase domain-containing protein [Candidatus Aenigmatarchaeota archaeon]
MQYFSEIYNSWKNIQEQKYKVILDLLKKENVKLSEGLVLDIGCGPFYFESFLEKNGIDTSNFFYLDIEARNPSKHFVLGDANAIPFKPRTFFVVFCIDVIHLINNPNELYEITKENGLILASLFFNKENMEERTAEILDKLNRFKILREVLLTGRESEIIILGVRDDRKEQ